GQLLGRTQGAAEFGAVVEPVAAAEQQARGAGGDEAASVDHPSSFLSGGTRKRPVIIDPISLIGPASSTIIKWTKMKPSSSAAQMKWIERADCRPPNTTSSHGQAASIAGDIVSPVSTISGRSTKMTPT